MDTRVTVVRCERCRGSGSLTPHDGRLWCARCQEWACPAFEHHPVSALGADPEQGAVARATPLRRHALRVPPGWRIEYHEWYEGEIPDPELQQDLVLGTHAERDRVLDLSWYYGGRDTACYRVAVWVGSDPAPLVHVSEHESHSAALAAVEDLLGAVAAGRL